MRNLSIAAFVSAVLLMTGCASQELDGPRVGQWLLTGEATNGQSWTATFRLNRSRSNYSGTFAWKRNGADAGEESFTGTYDDSKKVITLTGQQTSGSVVTATYVATVSSDLIKMTDGRWTTPHGPAGTWRAERVADEAFAAGQDTGTTGGRSAHTRRR